MTKRGAPQAFLRDAIASDTDDCIVWPFGRSWKGYGRVRFEGEIRIATNVVLILDGRPKPPESEGRTFCALHSCDNPPCVNPRHLRWGTHVDNAADAVIRRRIRHGVRHPSAKLTPDDVLEIRRRARAGDGPNGMAREYGVDSKVIRDVVARRIWRHVPEEVVR